MLAHPPAPPPRRPVPEAPQLGRSRHPAALLCLLRSLRAAAGLSRIAWHRVVLISGLAQLPLTCCAGPGSHSFALLTRLPACHPPAATTGRAPHGWRCSM